MMVSTDGGVNVSAAGNAGSGGSKIIRTIPGREGHIWVALGSGGLTHSEDSGTSFTRATNVNYCGAVGIGLTFNGYETIYIYGTVAGTLGIHRSTDKGATWVRVNDNNHQYGGPSNGQFVQGDMNVFGRVYMSTA
jgi:xyloglucan-specific exo-beta-1,4-glucanase